MADKQLSSSQVVMKEGAELVNVSTGVVTSIKSEKTIRKFLDTASKKGPIEESRVIITDDGGKKLKMMIGNTEYYLKKKYCEINEGAVDNPVDPLEDALEDSKPKTEEQLRAEAKAAKKEKKAEIKKLAAEKEGKDLDDDDDDDDNEKGADEKETTGKGKDMDQILETMMGDANTPDEVFAKLPEKFKRPVAKWIMLRGKMLIYEAKFAKYFVRTNKSELRKAYGKDEYKDKDYAQLLFNLHELCGEDEWKAFIDKYKASKKKEKKSK